MTGSNDPNDPSDAPAETPPDAADIARRFVDLWQAQVQAMATDPEVADTVQRWAALWSGHGRAAPASGSMADGLQPGYAAGTGSAYSARHDTGTGQTQPRHGPPPGRPTAGAAPASAVPERGGDDLALILRELRRLEERIAGLEARLERDGSHPEGAARRVGSGKGPRRGRD